MAAVWPAGMGAELVATGRAGSSALGREDKLEGWHWKAAIGHTMGE